MSESKPVGQIRPEGGIGLREVPPEKGFPAPRMPQRDLSGAPNRRSLIPAVCAVRAGASRPLLAAPPLRGVRPSSPPAVTPVRNQCPSTPGRRKANRRPAYRHRGLALPHTAQQHGRAGPLGTPRTAPPGSPTATAPITALPCAGVSYRRYAKGAVEFTCGRAGSPWMRPR